MEMRYLGKSGLKVSALCLGTMTFGGIGKFAEIGNVSKDEAKEFVSLAFEGGINFFDTADAYSDGVSEEILGQALGVKRKDAIICTKTRFKTGTGPNGEGLSRYRIIDACNNSLKRLNTDYIDIYMMHSIDIHTPMEETMRALDDLVRQGKVRYIGCSNYSAWHLMKSLSISEKHGFERFVIYQGYYSLLAREIENEIIPLCLDQGVGIMVWSPLSGGYLSGKFRKGMPFPKGTRVGDNEISNFIPPVDDKKAFEIIDVMEGIAAKNECSAAQVAINYLLTKPAVSALVLGIRKKEQLRDNIKALNWKLSEDDIAALDKISQAPLIYPYWHHKLTGVDK
jgi:aryl-alcohol dehydrogenase-like predicted oxidoreductase